MRNQEYSKLSLRVEKLPFRRFVPQNKEQERNISEDGMLYEDDTWQVKLFTSKRPEDLFLPKMTKGADNFTVEGYVSATYRGPMQLAKKNSRCQFSAGLLELSVIKNTERGPFIGWSLDSYDNALWEKHAINHYAYEDPNIEMEVFPQRDSMLSRIFSDGEVECRFVFNGTEKTIINPKAKSLRLIEAGVQIDYKVTEATWMVICEFDAQDKSNYSATLCTKSDNLSTIIQKIDDYLDEHFEYASNFQNIIEDF